MLRLLGTTSALCFVLFGSAVLFGQESQSPAFPASRTGPQIFADSCASCHGSDLAGGTGAKSLFTSDLLSARSDEQLRAAIEAGPPHVPDHSFKNKFTDNQIFQILAFLRIQGSSLKPKPFAGKPDGEIIQSRKQAFRVETVVEGLETPWGITFLPSGQMLVTERPGRLRIVTKDGRLLPPVSGTPKVWERQDAGMFDVALHPDYAHNGWIYLSFSDVVPGYQPPAPVAPQPGQSAPQDAAPTLPIPPSMTVLIRGRINDRNEWTDTQEIYRADPAIYTANVMHYGSRFLFDHSGHLFFSIGERGNVANAQNLSSPLGKIHRVNDDGSIPADNPFVDSPGAIKSIWSYGHRNPEGLAFDPVTKYMWETEHGPTGGDELNLIEKGKNYGWAKISMGIQPGITKTAETGMEQPVAWWTPTIAPSGIHFYTGRRYPKWHNNLFIAALAGQQLRRLEIKGRKVVEQEVLFDRFGRARAATTGPDGLLYVLLQDPTGQGTGLPLAASTPGRVVRLVPVAAQK